MEHDVNVMLLGLVLMLVVSMIAMVVYYRITYESLNDNYNSKMQELENISVTLNSTMMRVQARDEELQRIEKQLRDFADELNLSMSRESELGDHFKELKGEKEQVAEELNKTEYERGRYENLYNKYYTDYRVCKQDYDIKAGELDTANNKLSGMTAKAVQMGQKVDYIQASIEPTSEDLVVLGDKADYIYDNIDQAASNSTVRSNIKNYADDIKDLKTSIKGIIDSLKQSATDISDLADSMK